MSEMALEVSVRRERASDAAAIHEVEEMAFGRAFEADAVDALREQGKVVLSLVAEVAGEIVGHVLFSWTTIEMDKGTVREASLGPIGVTPEHQGKGIGGALVKAGLRECAALGYGAVFLLGNPVYYGRFGFRPASEYGIRYHQELTRPEAFQLVVLREGALGGVRGVAREEPELG